MTVLKAVPVSTDSMEAGRLVVESSNPPLGSMDVVAVTPETIVFPEGQMGAGSGHGHKGNQDN